MVTTILFKVYLTKEALVRIAENDQENEFSQLNEQIESQNIENINLAIMNCKNRNSVIFKIRN